MSSPCSHSHRATGSFPYNLFTSSSIKGFGPLNSYPTENCDAFSSNANFMSFLTTWGTGSEVKFSHANRCWGVKAVENWPLNLLFCVDTLVCLMSWWTSCCWLMTRILFGAIDFSFGHGSLKNTQPNRSMDQWFTVIIRACKAYPVIFFRYDFPKPDAEFMMVLESLQFSLASLMPFGKISS